METILEINYKKNPFDLWNSLKTKAPVTHQGFDSLYDYCKASSQYHFDENIEDGIDKELPVIVPICRFEGDWLDEARTMSAKTVPATFDYRAETRWDNNNSLEYNDFKRWGYDVDNGYVILNRLRHAVLATTFQKMSNLFRFEHPGRLSGGKPNIKFDVQKPGQMFYWHLDNFGGILKEQRNDYNQFADCDHDQRKLMRLIIFLDDQQPGHVWKQGNCYLKWKKGDCIAWPWRDIPHGTANFGHTDRPTLNITGRVTDGTLDFLKSCNGVVSL